MKDSVLKLIQQSNISLNKIQSMTNIEQESLTKIIQELVDEKLIFLNTANKYEVLCPEYSIGVLEKTSNRFR